MILLVSAHFPPEPVAAASLAQDLAIALSEKMEVVILTPRPSRPLGFSFKKGSQYNGKYEHVVLRSITCPRSTIASRMLESYSFGRHVVRYIRKNHRVIKCIYVLAWPLLAQYQIIKSAKKYSIPSVTHIVDIYPESLINKLPVFKRMAYSLLLPVDRYILQNSSRIITISAGMKYILEESRNLVSHKVEVVHMWQDESIFLNYTKSSKNNPANSIFTFMFLGSLSPTAALEYIVLAYRKSGLNNSRLIIAGNGSEKESLIMLAKDCKNGKIEFWDAPLQKVPEIQSQADVLMISLRKNSAHFAMPSKLPAYMFSKRPIIACVENDSDIALALKNSDCGWVVRPEDWDDLALTMAKVISVPKHELLSYGENGFHYAVENFSKEKNLDKLVSIIEQVNET